MPDELPVLVDGGGHAAAHSLLVRLGLLGYARPLELALVPREGGEPLLLGLGLGRLFRLTLRGVLALLLRERLGRLQLRGRARVGGGGLVRSCRAARTRG